MNKKLQQLKLLKKNLKDEYSNHIKKIHRFFEQFDVKDNQGRLVESGFQYMRHIQKDIIEKFYDDDKCIIETIGEEKWKYYKELMMKEKILREKEEKIKHLNLT